MNRPAPFCLRVGPLIGRFCKYFDCRALQVFVLYIKNNFTKNTEVQIEVGKLGHIKTPKLHHFLEFISYNKYLTFHIKLQKVENWLSRNLLKFNISNTELSLNGSSWQLSKLSGSVTICLLTVTVAVEAVRNLGLHIVHTDQHMKGFVLFNTMTTSR